ncbi:MAG: HD domain-containing protein [Clostridiales bacterium]|nr:HD domain-containing protein [Clostridiales bacterium]
MNRQTFALIEGYMLTSMKDAAHDKEHVYRVLNNAVRIAKSEPEVHWDVLLAAALLHDISRPEQIADPMVDHASHGADKAYAFLKENGFAEDFCSHVRACIRTHRFRKTERPATLEARILFDADKLDVAGAIGIARTLAYNGETGRPIYTRDENGVISDGDGDTADSFFREYKFKLEGICGHFLTEAGRALALERHAAAKAYYEALLQEVRDNTGRAALDALLDA